MLSLALLTYLQRAPCGKRSNAWLLLEIGHFALSLVWQHYFLSYMVCFFRITLRILWAILWSMHTNSVHFVRQLKNVMCTMRNLKFCFQLFQVSISWITLRGRSFSIVMRSSNLTFIAAAGITLPVTTHVLNNYAQCLEHHENYKRFC